MRSHLLQLLTRGCILFCVSGASAQILPSGSQVTAGQAVISSPAANSLVVTQSSDKAIINWNNFSIGSGGVVQINNGTGATLNRVTGGAVSSIDGKLLATGSVYLLNPNGVVIGKLGVVKTGGSFVASTLQLFDGDFLAGGDALFSGDSSAAVVNLGKIGSLGGNITLLASTVRNDGKIAAAKGTAGLIAGHTILMRDSVGGQSQFFVQRGGSDTSVTNTGAIAAATAELRAEGGNIFALAGNTTGIIRATGVANKGGKIYLTAGTDGSVTISGTTIAASDALETGGRSRSPAKTSVSPRTRSSMFRPPGPTAQAARPR